MSRSAARGLVVLPAASLAGCARLERLAGRDTLPGQVLRHLAESRVDELLLAGLAWGVVGAVAGALAGLLLFLLARRVGLFRSERRFATPLRVAGALACVAGGTASLGMVGLLEGGWRGADRFVKESPVVREHLPVVGDAGADLVACACVLARHGASPPSAEELERELGPFRRGEQEVDVVELFERGRRLEREALTTVAAGTRARVLALHPGLQGGYLERLLEEALIALGDVLVRRVVREELGAVSHTPIVGDLQRVVDGLPAAAARSGDPRTISRQELSRHVVEVGLLPAVLEPLRALVRSQQTLWALLLPGSVLGAALAFWLVERLRRCLDRDAPPAPSTPPS